MLGIVGVSVQSEWGAGSFPSSGLGVSSGKDSGLGNCLACVVEAELTVILFFTEVCFGVRAERYLIFCICVGFY